VNDKIDANQEALRSLAADYQNVFSTPQGQRVLRDIFGRVLHMDAKLTSRPIDWAPYLCAMHDAATDISKMLNLDFEQVRPKLAPRPQSRFTSRSLVA
jgi:hypothetical protein